MRQPGSRRRVFVLLAGTSVALAAAAGAAGGSPVGTMEHPVPLGRTTAVGGGWFLRVGSVDWNAAAKIAAVPGQYGLKPLPARREVMLAVTVSYRGVGPASIAVDFADRVYVIAADKLPWGWDSVLNDCGPGMTKLPPPDLQPQVEQPDRREVSPGTTISGHVCFEVPKNAISTLHLYVTSIPKGIPTSKPLPRTWFALR